MGTEHVINRIKDDILAASASVEGEENDMYAAGQRLAYTNALAIILEACTSESVSDDEHDKNN